MDVLAQRLLETSREGVRAVEDGEVARPPAARVDLAGDVGGDPIGLVFWVGWARRRDRLAFVVVGEEPLLLSLGVVSDELVGDAENALGAAIVLLQPHDLDRAESPFRTPGCC